MLKEKKKEARRKIYHLLEFKKMSLRLKNNTSVSYVFPNVNCFTVYEYIF